MKNMKILWLVFLLVPCSLFAQIDRSNYALLWEISGNNLPKKSYLFGSMHINDKRVFEFSDSLLPLMESCEAFAMEVHLDTLLETFLNNNQLLSEYQRRDGERKSWGLSQFGLKKGDKATFLDAYLFNLAKSMGKDVYGLEDVEEHFNLYKEMVKTIEDTLNFDRDSPIYEEFVRGYTQGDLNYFDQFYKADDDSILILRNYTMLKSMEAVMPNQSLFTVVGLLHLVGEEGLLTLLRKKGYTVRKVSADFTGLADTYELKKSSKPIVWYETYDTQQGIVFSTPQKPMSMLISPEKSIQAYFYPDLGKGIFYFVFSIDASNEDLDTQSYEAKLQQLSDSLGQNFDAEVLSGKWIKNEEEKIYEFILQNKKETLERMRLRFMVKDKKFFIVLIMTIEDLLEHPDIQRFYDSISIRETDKNWKVFSNPQAAFSVKMQGEPTYQYRETDMLEERGKQEIHFYTTMNQDEKRICFMRFNDFPTGVVVLNDSLVFESLKNNFLNKMEDQPYEWSPLELNGYPGYALSCIPEKSIQLRSQFYLRGNRVYLLLIQETEGQEDNTFFDSFRFEPYQKMVLNVQEFEDINVSLLFPKEFKQSGELGNYGNSDIRNVIAYEGTEPSTGSVFVAASVEFSKYAYFPDADSLFDYVRDFYVEAENHQIIKEQKEQDQGKYTRFHILESKQSNNRTLIRMILDHDRFYILAAYVPYEIVDFSELDGFFNSLAPLQSLARNEWSLFSPKLDLILQDLSSTDSLSRAESRQALRNYTWKQEEIGKLYQALAQEYEEDSLEYLSVTSILLDAFFTIHDSSTVHFLKNFYAQDSAANYHSKILEILAGIPEKESIELFLELAKNFTPDDIVEDYWNMVEGLTSSWELLEPYLPQLIALSEENPMYHNLVFGCFYQLLADSLITPAYFKTYQARVLELSLRDLRVIQRFESSPDYDEAENYAYHEYSALFRFVDLCFLLKPDQEIITHLETITRTDLKYQWLKINILNYFLSNQLKPEPQWIDELLADSITYIRTLQILQNFEKLALVGKQHLNQEKIAYLLMSEHIDDNELDFYTYQLELLSVENVKFLGESQKIHVYKILAQSENYDFDENLPENENNQRFYQNTYLGIAGPIQVNKKFIDLSSEITNMYLDPLDFEEIDLKAEVQHLVEESETYSREYNEE